MSDEIIGSGGGKGGGRRAKEAPNTLRSASVVRVVEVVSEGEIEGIAGGARGIYINDTPLQNADGSYNFERVQWDVRTGMPDQKYMEGFPGVQNEIIVNSAVLAATPVVRRVAAIADRARVTIQLPQGLYQQDTKNGDIKGTELAFRIEKKLATSGAWVVDTNVTLNDKTMTPYERAYSVQRPSGSGSWDIRVVRVTPDSTSAAVRNSLTWARFTEIQDLKLQYNNTAYVGVAIDAESVGSQIPTRGYLVKGLKIKIPSNYNPSTRTYSGIWNGTLVTSSIAVDNPAWVLYDLITHPRYGLGEFINESMVDKFAFYNAAVYCDQLVPNGKGGQEPRFTFNAVIDDRREALQWLNDVASAMRARLLYVNGVITVVQDRPADPVMTINKANVIDGKFTYKSSGLFDRHTAFNVTFADREDRFLPRTTTIVDSAGIARYGYHTTDIVSFGATTEGQAQRTAKWALESELNQTEIVQFRMSLEAFTLLPYDIIQLYDSDYAGLAGTGRIVSVTGTTVVLDRALQLSAGSTISVTRPNPGAGSPTIIETRNVSQTSGTLSTITLTAPFSQTVEPGTPFFLKTTLQARQFRVIGLKQEEKNIISVEAIYHDPTKYARVETGISVANSPFSNFSGQLVLPPTNFTVRESAFLNQGELARRITLSWSPPATGNAPSSYKLEWRLDSGPWTTVEKIAGLSYDLNQAVPGSYQFRLYSRGPSDFLSSAVTLSFVLDVGGLGTSPLSPVTNLQLRGGGTTFTGDSVEFEFVNPNNTSVATLKDFMVRVINADTLEIQRTFYLPPVEQGQKQAGSYTYQMNLADNSGTARRNVRLEVRCRDTNNKVSLPTIGNFSNPPPAAVASPSANPSFNEIWVRWTANTEPDLEGYVVWASTTNNFTPSLSNRVYVGKSNAFDHTNLSVGATYYYRIAAFDSFSVNPETGAGLNLSAQISASPLSIESDNEYRAEGITWTPNSPANNQLAWTAGTIVKIGGPNSGSTWAVPAGNSPTWTTGITYVYFDENNPATLLTTTSLPTAIASKKIILATYRGGTDVQFGNGRAYIDGSYVIAGTVGAAQLVTGTAVITEGAQIANAIISEAKITGTISANKIDGRGLTIRDASGNIILNAGTSTFTGTVGTVPSSQVNQWSSITGTGKPADNATNNTIYRSSTAPESPSQGDFWIDLSVNPTVTRIYVNGAWQVAANFTTNTNQLTDGAGLGSTAIWSSITGTGKPADNATANRIFRQSTAPTGVVNGDIWVDTSVNPVVTRVVVGGVWQVAANNTTNTNQLTDGAGLGLTANWSNISGVPSNVVNATSNRIFRQSTLPSGVNGDFWYNTSTAFVSGFPPNALMTNVNGTWFLSGMGQITPASASTFIQDAAIGTAQIGNLAVNTAKIADLSVTRLKIPQGEITTMTLINPSSATVHTVSGSVNIQSGASAALVLVNFGVVDYVYSWPPVGGSGDSQISPGGSAWARNEPARGFITINGTNTATMVGSGQWSTLNPGVGTATIGATRVLPPNVDGYTYSTLTGKTIIQIAVFVSYR